MTVFRAICKPDCSWPTRLAPLLHEITFCLGLSYVKEGAILGTINMFSQWRQHVKSLYFKVLTLFQLLPLTLQFTTSLLSCREYYTSLLLTVLDIIYSSSNIAKTSALYILLTGLCAGCFWTVCPGWKCGWERIWPVNMQAVSIATKIKHNDVCHQDINYNCLHLLYYS